MTVRTCAKCKVEKPSTQFYRKLKGLQSYCKECKQTDDRQRKYNLDVPEFHAMYYNQRGRCAVCNVHGDLVVDHAHDTKAIRGLLCHNCNTGLGLFKEEVEVLRQAIKYLGGLA